jgi:hypothetical protein
MWSLLLAVLIAALSVIPSPWRWVTLAGLTVLGLVVAGVVSDRRGAARSRATDQQAATDAAAKACKPGDRVRLVAAKYAGASGLRPGDLGTVTGEDEWGIIEVNWDNGVDYGLVPGPDQFELVQGADAGGDQTDTSLGHDAGQ